ncbi:MAG: glycosyltransferase, partial [Chloroflexi bacterium]|nr:glycosyltransferase [Chloroflexota bacterium]
MDRPDDRGLDPAGEQAAAHRDPHSQLELISHSLAFDYPADRFDLLIVADGSTDRTAEIVASYAAANPRVRLLYQPKRQGKAAALRRAWGHIVADAVLFTDANCTLPRDALAAMVAHLADPHVGGVGGAKRFERAKDAVGQGEGFYWRYEAFLKRCDSSVSSVMGVPGEVWLARREAYTPPEPDILLDDFVASMRMVAAGWRIPYEPRALAQEPPSPNLAAEWERRVRNAAGGWQAVLRLKEVWQARPLVVWQYVSHRVLRWIVTPALIPILLGANLLLVGMRDTPRFPYLWCALGQGIIWLVGVMGGVWAWKGRCAS